MQDITCFLGSFLRDDTACEATAGILNKMIDAHLSGLFVDCQMTTPTTSVSSTQTTSASTTGTSTQTSSKTTSDTSSKTTTASTSHTSICNKHSDVYTIFEPLINASVDANIVTVNHRVKLGHSIENNNRNNIANLQRHVHCDNVTVKHTIDISKYNGHVDPHHYCHQQPHDQCIINQIHQPDYNGDHHCNVHPNVKSHQHTIDVAKHERNV